MAFYFRLSLRCHALFWELISGGCIIRVQISCVGSVPCLTCVLWRGGKLCANGEVAIFVLLRLCAHPSRTSTLHALQHDCLCPWSFLNRHSVMDKHVQHFVPRLVGEGSQVLGSQASCIPGCQECLIIVTHAQMTSTSQEPWPMVQLMNGDKTEPSITWGGA